jgi:uncharacterized glyoxalase superfamily protein PhnB
MPKIHLDHQTPVFAVANLQETVAYYKEKLGFSGEWFAGDQLGGVGRDSLRAIFSNDPDYLQKINTPDQSFEVMWFMSGIHELYEEYAAKGVAIWKPLQKEPWGMWEFGFQDNNGYSIRVAQGASQDDGN